jgi:hypothetical protein
MMQVFGGGGVVFWVWNPFFVMILSFCVCVFLVVEFFLIDSFCFLVVDDLVLVSVLS